MRRSLTAFAFASFIVLSGSALATNYECTGSLGCIYDYLNPVTGQWETARADHGDIIGTGSNVRINESDGWQRVV